MQRPTSITVFGILNLAFAGWGVIGVLGSAVLFFMPGNTNNPVIKTMHENPGYAAWLKICIPLGILTSLVLLAAGIGLLRLKSWGRMLSIGYGVYAILFGIVGIIVNFICLISPMLSAAKDQQSPEAAGGAIGAIVGGTFGGCIGLIYPAVLLVFMFRSNVKAAFAGPPPILET